MTGNDAGPPGWPGPAGGGPQPYPPSVPPGAGYGGPPPPGYPAGPTGPTGAVGPTNPYGATGPFGPGGGNYQFPNAPRPPSAKRTAIIAALAGTLVVVVAAALILVFMLKDDDEKSGKAAPTNSATSGRFGSSGAPGTPTGPTGTARPTARQLALPPTLDGRRPMAESDLPSVVADVRDVFARDFADVELSVYGTRNNPDSMLALIGTKQSVRPSDFVRDFVPQTGAQEQTVTWRQPGKARCWATEKAVACMWGDDAHLLYVSSVRTPAYTIGQLEKIYLGQAS
ncbi:hypothetical protein [Yinghuangia soli]|uniref:Uncharacterized protein n=1 Tax=Yinghuangia soli TaxID=2908204 RepID=A0AA41QAT1_9ACTN|nr:hypothetical protein [Yinghuangia soli]MCF2533514.1 hypothetical protein [Yinghuangia soli]